MTLGHNFQLPPKSKGANNKIIAISCSEQDTYQTLTGKIKSAFTFPDLFGSNLNALIEGFLLLRFPEETLAQFSLEADEVVLLELQGASALEYHLLHFLVLAVESANATLTAKNLPPAIILLVK